MLNLVDSIGGPEIQAVVEEISRLSSSSILVSDDDGKILLMVCRMGAHCSWTREAPATELGAWARECPTKGCPFSNDTLSSPIEVQGDVVGHVVACLDQSAQGSVEGAVRLVSEAIASKVQSEFELNSLSAELLERYEEINLLYDVGEAIGAVFDADTIYEVVLRKGTEVIGARKASIMILDDNGKDLRLVAARALSENEMATSVVRVGEGISGRVVKEAKPLLIEDAKQLPQSVEDITEIESFIAFPTMSVPLMVRDKVLGVINMSEKSAAGTFAAGDLKLLSAIASQAAISIYNCRLVEELKESERLKRDMEIAHRIQMSFLPKEPPTLPGVELAGRCVPAANVGGDYYDFFSLSQDELGIVIADVTGHSIGASLMMAAARSVLRSQAFQGLDVSEVVARTNAITYEDLAAAELFITMFYLRYDRRISALTYANGGHNPPFVYRAGDRECVLIDADGMMLGVIPETQFQQGTERLEPGDILVLYTDGVTEATNPAGEQFGEDRLRRIVKENSHMTAQALLERIYAQIREYGGNIAQRDDITLIIMKLSGGLSQECAAPT